MSVIVRALFYVAESASLRAELAGEFGIGSGGQPSAARLAEVVSTWMTQHPDMRVDAIEVDFTCVDYEWGDGPVSSLVPFLSGGVGRLRIVASARNLDALLGMIQACGVPGIELYLAREVDGHQSLVPILHPIRLTTGMTTPLVTPEWSPSVLSMIPLALEAPLVSGGYFLVRGTRVSVGSSAVAQMVWSPSDGVCRHYPGVWLEPSACHEALAAALADAGLSDHELPALRHWVQEESDANRLGPWGVFPSIESARRFARRFLTNAVDIKLLGIGLPAVLVSAFLKQAESIEGGTPTEGIFEAVSARHPMVVGGTPVGYEPLGYESSSSSLRNHLTETWTLELFAGTLNAHGRFDDLLTSAWAADMQVEQAVWFPWAVVEYPL